jgi:hypothetical protein
MRPYNWKCVEVGLTVECSDFWGPASNFGIPIAAIADMSKDPEMYVHTPILAPHPHPIHTYTHPYSIHTS